MINKILISLALIVLVQGDLAAKINSENNNTNIDKGKPKWWQTKLIFPGMLPNYPFMDNYYSMYYFTQQRVLPTDNRLKIILSRTSYSGSANSNISIVDTVDERGAVCAGAIVTSTTSDLINMRGFVTLDTRRCVGQKRSEIWILDLPSMFLIERHEANRTIFPRNLGYGGPFIQSVLVSSSYVDAQPYITFYRGGGSTGNELHMIRYKTLNGQKPIFTYVDFLDLGTDQNNAIRASATYGKKVYFINGLNNQELVAVDVSSLDRMSVVASTNLPSNVGPVNNLWTNAFVSTGYFSGCVFTPVAYAYGFDLKNLNFTQKIPINESWNCINDGALTMDGHLYLATAGTNENPGALVRIDTTKQQVTGRLTLVDVDPNLYEAQTVFNGGVWIWLGSDTNSGAQPALVTGIYFGACWNDGECDPGKICKDGRCRFPSDPDE